MISTHNYKFKRTGLDINQPLKNRLLEARGISESEISGTYSDLLDPFLINDMDIAVNRIIKARDNKEKVIIYGDYDCDGITSTLEMKKGLSKIGIECDYYIPRRLIDGYGMNMFSIFDIIDNNYDLVITVDCGITSIEEISMLQDSGVDVIVTDHHQCKDILPPAIAILDNQRKDNKYPFVDICGAGMAFKVITAIYQKLGMQGEERDLLPLVAMGTVADVMPLIRENRIFVTEGLEFLKNTEDFVYINLLRVAGKLEDRENLTAQDLAFYFGPLINAASRVGDIKYAINLLSATTEEEAVLNADELAKFNAQRKEIESKIEEEAFSQIISNYDFKRLNPIIVWGNNWHRGVIGIVASRIVEKFNRPTVIFSNENGELHGSCRSYGDINIMHMLKYSEEYIYKYGGHPGAAGLTVKEKNLDNFIKKMNEYASKTFTEEMFIPTENIDLELRPDEINLDSFNELKTFEPFGKANEEPVFICRGLKTKVIKKIGTKAGSENAHLKITFSLPDDPLNIVSGIGFFISDFADILPSGRKVDVIFKLQDNTWKNSHTVQLMIQDIIYTPNFPEGTSIEEDSLFVDEIISIPEIMEEYNVNFDQLLPNKANYLNIFNAINQLLTEPKNNVIITDLSYLTSILSTRTNELLTPFKVSRVLDILGAANQIVFKRMLFDKLLIAKADPNTPKIRLSQTDAFKKLYNLGNKGEMNNGG